MNTIYWVAAGLLAQGLAPTKPLSANLPLELNQPIAPEFISATSATPFRRLAQRQAPESIAVHPEPTPTPLFIPFKSSTPNHPKQPLKQPTVATPPQATHTATTAWGNLPSPSIAPHLISLVSPRPTSGSQLYHQRWAALQAGRTYTRLPANSFWQAWSDAIQPPTHEQWVRLLAQEGRSMARGQGANRLTVMVGDSLSLWFPVEHLTSDRFWLNQGISGDTTAGVLQRLSAFEQTNPDVIHVMIGINDLRRGASDTEILSNIQQIMRRLKQTHPQATIYIHSILPTRLEAIPLDRITPLNQQIAIVAQQEQVQYVDLIAFFLDEQGVLHRDLTTDGLHLSLNGYAVWDWAMRSLLTV